MFRYLMTYISLFLVFSCKRSYDKNIIGPEIQSSHLIEPFQANLSSINFRSTTENFVTFNGKFEKISKWKIKIIGLTSGAAKTIYGNSEDLSLSSVWKGDQDSLYFFRDGEYVITTLYLNNSSFKSTNVSLNLDNRGDLIADDEIARDTILIVKGKPSNPNQVELFTRYVKVDECLKYEGLFYTAGYDIEPSPLLDIDPSIYVSEAGNINAVGDESMNLLQYSKYQGGLRGPRFFMLKGQDLSTKIATEKGPDYYVGRLASVNLRNPKDAGNRLTFGDLPDLCGKASLLGLDVVSIMEKALTPDSLYFNVFVYGNGDGSKINYTIKEDDDLNGSYLDGTDESYEKSITVNFTGWKSFSLRYSDFTKAPYRNPQTGVDETAQSGNKVKDINHIIQIQFGLVASDKGKNAQMIIDNPTVSVGRPFSY